MSSLSLGILSSLQPSVVMPHACIVIVSAMIGTGHRHFFSFYPCIKSLVLSHVPQIPPSSYNNIRVSYEDFHSLFIPLLCVVLNFHLTILLIVSVTIAFLMNFVAMGAIATTLCWCTWVGVSSWVLVQLCTVAMEIKACSSLACMLSRILHGAVRCCPRKQGPVTPLTCLMEVYKKNKWQEDGWGWWLAFARRSLLCDMNV